MKNVKRIICLALALIFAVSAVSFNAFAAKTTPTATITVEADKTDKIANGDAVTVTVYAEASEDYYVGPVSIPVTYDTSLFKASEANGEKIFGADTTEISSHIDEANGRVTVVITPNTTGEPTAPNINGNKTALYSFKLTAQADSGSCEVAVVNDLKTPSHTTGTVYMGSFDGSDPREAELTTMGQTLVIDNAKVKLTIGEDTAPADLELTSKGTDASIIIDRKKTFGGQYDGAVYGFEKSGARTFMTTAYLTDNLQATNEGTLEFSRTIGKSGYGTGTLITVKNSDTSESKHYIVIIFGDVDGNGLIAIADATAVKAAISNQEMAPQNSVKRMAANCNGTVAATLDRINLQDASALKYSLTHENSFSASVTVKTLAAAHQKANTYYQ